MSQWNTQMAYLVAAVAYYELEQKKVKSSCQLL
jgi:hypothetical protein